MKLLHLLFVVLISSLNSHAWATSGKKVVALLWSQTIEGQIAMRNGLEEAHQHHNQKSPDEKIELIIRTAGDGKNGIRNQIKQFKETLELKPDLIIIQPTDNASLTSSLKQANAKKIPVIAFDQYISGGELLSYVTSDNYQAGKLNAEYIHSLFPSDLKLSIVLLEYPRVSSTIERVDGFLETLKSAGRSFQIVARYEAVEPEGGKKAAQKMLKEFPIKGSIHVVFSVNDGGGISFVESLHKSDRNEVVHATVDGDPESIENIKNKKITKIDTAQFCAEIGRQSMKLGLDYLDGKKIPRKVLIPTFPVTAETYHLYNGWMGSMPESFVKPWSKNKEQWKRELKTLF